jgi:hypothetical protein
VFLPRGTNKPETLARQRLYQALGLAVVSDRDTDRIDAGRECRVRNGAASPNGRYKFVLADHTFSIAQQVVKHIKYLRGHGDQAPTPAELAPVGIERIIFEKIAQVVFSLAVGRRRYFSMPGDPSVKKAVRKM